MLIDNRAQGKASVVVIPTTEWDKLRKAKLQSEIVNDTASYFKKDNVEALQPVKIVPIDGSNLIQFSNRTDSNLAGCSAIGDIEVLHKGTMDDAVIRLKNEAHRFNTNILIPVSMKQLKTNAYASSVQIEARMMKCPLKLAQGN